MQNNQGSLKSCIELCWTCRNECNETLFNHCLEEGGKHVAPEHVRLMSDCIQICQTAADFMTRQSPMHEATCAACADICEACAKSCEAIGGEQMKRCADVCRKCSKSCRDVGQMKKAA